MEEDKIETVVDDKGEETLYVDPQGKTDEQVEAPEVKDEEVPAKETIEEIAPAKIKIGEQEYDPTELQDIVSKGSKIKEWETKMPGFNVDTFMPDYTRKSQLLATYEKRSAPKAQVDVKELEDLGVDDAQIKAFEKVAGHLGFVKQSDLVQNSVEAQKESFLSRHPEYAPGIPANDAKWGQLTQEFNLYDWKNHPDKVEKFLEKAHADISKSWLETERGAKKQEDIVIAKARANAVASSGGSSASSLSTKQSTSDEAALYRKAGWTEEQINELLT